MVFKTIALATVVLALATAPADALSGGKRSRDPVSTGPVSSTSFDGVIGNRHRAPVVSTSEPLAMLVVGLGLLAPGCYPVGKPLPAADQAGHRTLSQASVRPRDHSTFSCSALRQGSHRLLQ